MYTWLCLWSAMPYTYVYVKHKHYLLWHCCCFRQKEVGESVMLLLIASANRWFCHCWHSHDWWYQHAQQDSYERRGAAWTRRAGLTIRPRSAPARRGFFCGTTRCTFCFHGLFIVMRSYGWLYWITYICILFFETCTLRPYHGPPHAWPVSVLTPRLWELYIYIYIEGEYVYVHT